MWLVFFDIETTTGSYMRHIYIVAISGVLCILLDISVVLFLSQGAANELK